MVASVSPKLIKSLFAAYDEQAGVYGVMFFINGEWTYVLVDDRLPVGASGGPLFAYASCYPPPPQQHIN